MAFNKARVLQEAEKLVIQGKISQAIKRYFDIFERDPSELILLNTIGDLYIRDRNVLEGLKQFYRLAEAYLQDGFTLKAIAIYKKIVKLEPDSVDPLLKLGELYQAQRLSREARELYYQVAECYKKKKQNDKVLETLRQVVQLDVENATARARLAAFCEEIGRKDEAMQVYLETAQLAFRRGDTESAQIALKKALELDPDDPQIPLLRAREALVLKHPEEVEAILSATPGLKDDPAGRSLLVDSYLAMQQPAKAETLVLDLYRAAPADFSPLASFVSVCVQGGQFDAASKVLSAVADKLIEQGNTNSLMESLRLIWSKSPQHLPALELISRICDKRGDEYALPEILEALGHAYVQCGQFEKAEQSFQRLVSREPANQRYKVLLNQVLQKQGREFGKAHGADLPSSAAALTQEEGAAAPGASALRAADREAMVKGALESSELFARYHLVSKAIAELDRVLEIYPDEIEIHRRLVAMCWKDMPERAEQAAQALARIYAQQGDAEDAKRFAEMAGGQVAPAAVAVPLPAVRAPAVSPEPLPPLPAQPAATAAGETDLASESSLTPVQEAETAPTPRASSTASAGDTIELARPPEQEAPAATPAQIPFDLSAAPAVESPTTTAPGISLEPSIPPAPEAPPPAPLEMPLDLATLAPSAPPPAPSSEIQEIDLSEDWEAFLAQAATASPAPEAPQEAASFNYDDSRIEVNFYLEHGLFEEARKAVEDLERTLPGDLRIAELRALVEVHTGALAVEAPEKQPAEAPEKQPAEALEKQPAEAPEKQPAEALEMQPAEALEKQPAEALEMRPAEAPEKQPPEALEMQPAEALEKQPAEALEMQPAEALEKQPAETLEMRPAEALEMRPAEALEKQPAEAPEKQPAEALEMQPAEALEKQPPEALEKQPAEALEMQPAETLEKRPAEALEKQPAEALKMQPAETLEKQPAEALKPTPLEAVAPPAEEAVERLELASSYAAPEPEAQPAAAPPISPPEEEIPTEAILGVSVEATTNLLGDSAEAFGSAREGLEEPSPPPASPSAPTAESATGFTAPTTAPVSPLSELLEEIGEAFGTGALQEEDPETHYNLGVAFREMNLLDEAIGEFQKVVKDAGKGPHPPNYLQACTLLATCFMDKGMAPIAIKWYCRALETPDLDEEAWLALQYDLGVAYEQAGDLPRALERFSEVYGQNIDFRDVAEKVRTFQQKGS